MKVAVACDHAGFSLKQTVLDKIQSLGHEVIDCGTDSLEGVDFPDHAQKAGLLLQEKKADRAILICGSGIGMCIAANKIKGVYACVCHDTYSAQQGVEHDNMNALCLGALVVGKNLAEVLIESFLKATYFNTGNYQRRVNKIIDLEKNLKS